MDIKVVRDGLSERKRPKLTNSVFENPIDRPRSGDSAGAQANAVQKERRGEHYRGREVSGQT